MLDDVFSWSRRPNEVTMPSLMQFVASLSLFIFSTAIYTPIDQES